MGKTAIIILEYNNSEDAINCIESVLRFNTAPVKFVLVDNGSTRRQAISALEDYFADAFCGKWEKLKDGDMPSLPLPYLTFVESASNDGYARGNNKGLALAQADEEIDSVLILNSDILFVEDILPGLLKSLELENAGIVSPVLFKKDMEGMDLNCARRAMTVNEAVWKNFPYPYDALKINQKRRLEFRLDSGLMPIDLPSGSCMLLKKDVFERLGWFDPGTFLYFEEDILYEKTKAMGLQNYLDTGARCIHLGATTTKASPSRFVIDCGFESTRYYLKKYKGVNRLQLSLLSVFAWVLRLKIKIQDFARRNKRGETR
ncbi:MAG: glycosyltransferase family 2 protein [Clostridium sp.]|nr:glycosyltransferase family 2 protein [Clostridium sp.]